MDRTLSCEISRSLAQRESLEIDTLERSQLLARLDFPKSIPRKNLTHHHHSYLRLPPPRRFLPSLALLGHREYPRVLISPVLNGALVSWGGFAACLSRTQIALAKRHFDFHVSFVFCSLNYRQFIIAIDSLAVIA